MMDFNKMLLNCNTIKSDRTLSHKMTFIYDEETRNHTLNGKHIPSVSQVIDTLTDFSGIDPEILQRKTELGTEFHKAVELYLQDDLHMDSLDPDLVKPMEAFNMWYVHTRNIVNIEQPIYHKTLKYCGKPDLVVETAIFDWKLRKYMPFIDRLKLEAYRHIISRKKMALWTVCFDLDGKISIHNSCHRQSWGVFRRMLERYYRELEHNKLLYLWKGLC